MLEKYEHGGDIYGNTGIKQDFSVNINPFGLPDEVRHALMIRMDEFTQYPDPECRELCAAIALHENVQSDWVLCGNGAADLIYRLCFALKPKNALVCAPTFSEYERALKQTGCMVTYHTLISDNQFKLTTDIEDCLIPGIDILFLCHPNNPTGRLIPENLLERVLYRAKQNGTIVVVDECFLGFTDGSSSKRYLDDMPGLIVLKAFTKMYAMAGLRLGYLLTSDETLLNKISAAAQCWSVSVPAQIAGVAALSCEGWQDKTRRIITEERRFLSESLRELGIAVFPSDANYLLLRCEQPLYAPLLAKGILIRACENFKGLNRAYYRVGIQTRIENKILVQAVKEILYG